MSLIPASGAAHAPGARPPPVAAAATWHCRSSFAASAYDRHLVTARGPGAAPDAASCVARRKAASAASKLLALA
jgi:hypothetical protein